LHDLILRSSGQRQLGPIEEYRQDRAHRLRIEAHRPAQLGIPEFREIELRRPGPVDQADEAVAAFTAVT